MIYGRHDEIARHKPTGIEDVMKLLTFIADTSIPSKEYEPIFVTGIYVFEIMVLINIILGTCTLGIK